MKNQKLLQLFSLIAFILIGVLTYLRHSQNENTILITIIYIILGIVTAINIYRITKLETEKKKQKGIILIAALLITVVIFIFQFN